MRVTTPAMVFLLMTAVGASHFVRATQTRQAEAAGPCGPSGTAHMRTTMYFGLARPTGTVSEGEWREFVRNEVTPQFPDGLTVWEAEGQWRHADGKIGEERSKVLLLVHEDTPAARVTLGAVVTTYKQRFQQESVLWESSMVCAAF
jgi:hypothetical protein